MRGICSRNLEHKIALEFIVGKYQDEQYSIRGLKNIIESTLPAMNAGDLKLENSS